MQSLPAVPLMVLLFEFPTITFVPAGQHAGVLPGPTCTLAVQVPVAPALSVQVSVTVVVPTAKGPVGLITQLTEPPSGSNEPLLISALDTAAVHDVPASTATSLHCATGG